MQITHNLHALRKANPLYSFLYTTCLVEFIASFDRFLRLVISSLVQTPGFDDFETSNDQIRCSHSDKPIFLIRKKVYLFKRKSQLLPLKDSVMLEFLHYFNVVIVFTVFSIYFCCCCFVSFFVFPVKMIFRPFEEFAK